MVNEPENGCFLCDPEPWRTLLVGASVRVVAGLGPLCPGYVLLSPCEHLHTSSTLPPKVLYEFLTVDEILKSALAAQYGEGYTAYEHGKIGSCRTHEIAGDYSTFCHHCHRVYIPVGTVCEQKIGEWFKNSQQLLQATDITRLGATPYVYYESGNRKDVRGRWVFIDESGIPSQFMRRILSSALGTGRPYSWANDHRYPEMVDTVARLRTELAGLDVSQPGQSSQFLAPLTRYVTIDGFAGVGKTTIAQALAGRCNCRVVDTGVAWRWLAAQQSIQGEGHIVSAESLRPVLDQPVIPAELRDPKLVPLIRRLGSDPHIRESLTKVIRQAMAGAPPAIVVGRDAWRIIEGSADRFVVEADFVTRVRRRALSVARNRLVLPSLGQIENEFRQEDFADITKLPLPGASGIYYLNNGRRNLELTLQEMLGQLGLRS